MPLLPLLAFVICLAAVETSTGHAQSPLNDLRYELVRGGQRTLLSLRIDGRRVTGTLLEGQTSLVLSGQLQGQRLDGDVTLQGSTTLVGKLTAELQGDQLEGTLQPARGGDAAVLLMRRVGSAAIAAPRGGALDARVRGTWQQQTITNSGGGAGGFASFTVLRVLTLGADGSARQTMRSVGGGAGWSHRSEPELEFSGRWMSRNGEMWVLIDGEIAYQPIGRYQLEGDRMVLIGDGRRQIWRR